MPLGVVASCEALAFDGCVYERRISWPRRVIRVANGSLLETDNHTARCGVEVFLHCSPSSLSLLCMVPIS